jgi:DNA-binding NtrC family response regulator
MPLEEGEPIPRLHHGPQPQSSSPNGEEVQAIFKAIYNLKQEVDALKARIDRRELPAPPVPLEDEAEWQGQEEYQAERPVVRLEHHEMPEEEPSLSVRRSEEELIRQALEKYHGNRKKAAEELGMSERTLYRKLPPEYRKK